MYVVGQRLDSNLPLRCLSGFVVLLGFVLFFAGIGVLGTFSVDHAFLQPWLDRFSRASTS